MRNFFGNIYIFPFQLLITLEDFEGDALEVLIERFTIGSESTKYAISYSDAYYASINNPGKIINPKNFKLLYL